MFIKSYLNFCVTKNCLYSLPSIINLNLIAQVQYFLSFFLFTENKMFHLVFFLNFY